MAPYGTRGLMLDPGRLVERKERYFEYLPWLREWGYNMLHMHFTDDQNCAMVFPSRPELAGKHAFTADEMRRLVAFARRLGIEVMPEIESLGHTRFITDRPRYRGLGGGRARGFNAIDPGKPETRRVLRDLLRDTAEVFDCPVIHAGLDEVDFTVLTGYRKVPKGEHWRIFSRHAAWVHEEIRRLGRRPAMWGDHVLASPEMAKQFGSDVLMVDWHYWTPVEKRSLEFFAKSPFEYWGAPAVVHYGVRIAPNRNTLANLREFSARGMAYRSKGLSGMIVTWWCPWRTLPGAADLAVALGGHLLTEKRESPEFPAHFAREFYGLGRSDAAACAGAILRLYAIAPTNDQYDRFVWGDYWRTGKFDREDARAARPMAAEAAGLARELARLVPKAKRNADRLGDVALSARAVAAVGSFAASGRKRGSVKGARALLGDVTSAWNRDRWPDDPRLKASGATSGRELRDWMVHGLAAIL